MKYRWSVFPRDVLTTDCLSKTLNIPEIVAQCLVNRGISKPDDARLFLKPQLKNLSDPFLMPEMEKAVQRLFCALENDEPIVIFGDYDVDGVTSTAFLYDFLNKFGWNASYYLPNRMDEGYGLSPDGIKNCLEKHPARLIIAVDCGSNAVKVIEDLKKLNIDVIVLDHHQISSDIPDAIALVNPHLMEINSHYAPDSNSPVRHFRELCSVGIVFKLVHSILKRAREKGIKEAHEIDIRKYLDLVALGTVADLVPLKGENRILVTAGLKKLNTSPSVGLASLINVSSTRKPIGVHEIGFQIAPRLNAVGRLETAEEAFHLLLADSMEVALPLAQKLDAKNRERQMIEYSITEEAMRLINSKFNPETDYVIVEGKYDWHIGVVGIVASRVMQQFYRPAIIFGGDGDFLRGSCRSIEGFNIAEALKSCKELLVRFGGHSMAAGVTIEQDKVDSLREKLNNIAKGSLKREHFIPLIDIDVEVQLSDLTHNLVEHLHRLEPFGNGNSEVFLLARNVRHYKPLTRVGSERQHIKMWVTDESKVFEAIWWNAGNNSQLPTGRFDLVFTPEINEFNGQSSIILKVIDWRKSDSGN
ncbi:MAG: single-stranded-DNA-specific exonuclease RecJ [Verrucomicrobiia bacterium]